LPKITLPLAGGINVKHWHMPHLQHNEASVVGMQPTCCELQSRTAQITPVMSDCNSGVHFQDLPLPNLRSSKMFVYGAMTPRQPNSSPKLPTGKEIAKVVKKEDTVLTRCVGKEPPNLKTTEMRIWKVTRICIHA
jgi:hypothetical protein